MNKELELKNNEELCALILKMKLQLLESRFMRANGTLEKTHTIAEIRKTIARTLTILHKRNFDVSIGTHGVTLFDRANNTTKSINDAAVSIINSVEKEMGDNESKNPLSKEKTSSISLEKKQVEKKQVVKTDDKQKTPVIRKSSGGGA
jgi:large subunit ribosomal protein L29